MTAPRSPHPSASSSGIGSGAGPAIAPAPRPAYPPIRDKPDAGQPRFAESPFAASEIALSTRRKRRDDKAASPAPEALDSGTTAPHGHC